VNAEIELYAQGSSILHRWEPRCKFVALMVMMFLFAQFQSIGWALFGLIISYSMLLCLQLPFKIFMKRVSQIQLIFIPCFLILPFTASGSLQTFYGIQFSSDGVWMAVLFYIRAVSVVALSMVLIYSTPMSRLFHAAERLMIPSVIVQIAVLTYRYLFSLSWEWANVRNALKSRGFVNKASLPVYKTYANVIAASLVRSLERTDRVYNAMKCRGYQGQICLMHNQHVQLMDWVIFLCCTGTAATLFIIDSSIVNIVIP
jgi:cobalt/nickel transport system permease protein